MSKKRGFNCPICEKIFLKLELQDHVQKHFDESEGNNIVGMS